MDNIHNKLVTKQHLQDLISKYAKTPVSINNLKLFQKAFIHSSGQYINNVNSDSEIYSSIDPEYRSLYNNEKMEFLGDKVIDFITIDYLYETLPNKQQGDLTILKSRFVEKENLHFLGDKLGFKKMMIISNYLEKNDGRNNKSIIEDAFESFMCALYMDQKKDLTIPKKFLLGVYSTYNDLEYFMNNDKNFKTMLLQYYHTKKWPVPTYKNFYRTNTSAFRVYMSIPIIQFGEDNLSRKVVEKQTLAINLIKEDILRKPDGYSLEDLNEILKTEIIIGIGLAKTKKEAEQSCSKDTLENLKINFK